MAKSESIAPGMIVVNTGAPEWGLGKILLVDSSHIWAYFKDIEGAPKDAIKQLSASSNRLFPAATQHDVALDNLPPMVQDGKIHPPKHDRLTKEQAIRAFLSRYPGFDDSSYQLRERSYRQAAHQEVLPLLQGKGKLMLSDGRHAEVITILKRVIQRVGLLGTPEAIALNDAFKNSAATARFAEALLDFIEVPDEGRFSLLVEATGSLPAETGKARILTWPIVTLIPFLASPSTAMLLKPEMTKRISDIFSFDIHYKPTPNWSTYSRLIGLSRYLFDQLQPLGAKDFIDVQSFMWIVAGEPFRKVPDPNYERLT